MSSVPGVFSNSTHVSSIPQLTWLQRTGRAALLRQLERLQLGAITLIDRNERFEFGRRDVRCELDARIDVSHPQFWADAAFGGTVGAAESYVHGYWHCDQLTSLVRIMVLNRDVMNEMEGGLAILSGPLRRALHWANRNSKAGSRRNIAAHYDLGNDFFEVFLDETLAYSCGIFERADATMFDASIAKFAAACRKLQLNATDHLLEIGTGWGGLAIYAARHYGCRVTTTTISRAQYDLACKRVADAGLSERIEVRLDDYRDLQGQYDKLISIEMVEAVGHQFLETYLDKCSSLLKPEGAMLLQAITIQDQFYDRALRSVDFIQRYIFPGSFIPSITALTQAAAKVTDMKVAHLIDIGPHYATTLRLWRESFLKHIERIRALGHSEQFTRLWDYYFCYCEGGFLERQLGDVQMLLTKPMCRIEVS